MPSAWPNHREAQLDVVTLGSIFRPFMVEVYIFLRCYRGSSKLTSYVAIFTNQNCLQKGISEICANNWLVTNGLFFVHPIV